MLAGILASLPKLGGKLGDQTYMFVGERGDQTYMFVGESLKQPTALDSCLSAVLCQLWESYSQCLPLAGECAIGASPPPPLPFPLQAMVPSVPDFSSSPPFPSPSLSR